MNEVEWDLLFRYLGRECTADELTRVERWLAADERHRAILDAAQVAAGRTLATAPAAVPTTRRFAVTSAPSWRRHVGSGTAQRRNGWVFAAAASLMIAAVGTFEWRAHRVPASEWRSVPALEVATTGRGMRDTLRLQDGTRVVLAAASTLRYPAEFNGESRDVYLTGEGYFEVVHDTRHPFRVHAGDATAEDVGTAFGVRAYPEDSHVQVVVAEGEVALGATSSPAAHASHLTQGQLGRLDRGSAVASVQRVNVDAYLGWTKGRLVFEETPLSEVAVRLGRWYGTEFRVADTSKASSKLTATFTNESLAEVLVVLSQALDLQFERRGNTIVMRAQNARR